MDANPLKDLRRSNEEQYFLKKEKELLEELRLQACVGLGERTWPMQPASRTKRFCGNSKISTTRVKL